MTTSTATMTLAAALLTLGARIHGGKERDAERVLMDAWNTCGKPGLRKKLGVADEALMEDVYTHLWYAAARGSSPFHDSLESQACVWCSKVVYRKGLELLRKQRRTLRSSSLDEVGNDGRGSSTPTNLTYTTDPAARISHEDVVRVKERIVAHWIGRQYADDWKLKLEGLWLYHIGEMDPMVIAAQLGLRMDRDGIGTWLARGRTYVAKALEELARTSPDDIDVLDEFAEWLDIVNGFDEKSGGKIYCVRSRSIGEAGKDGLS